MTTRAYISLSVVRTLRIALIALALPIGLPKGSVLRGFVAPVAYAEEGGGEAAGILFGLAAMIAAAAPAVAASIQSKADVSIATINAKTQKDMTNTTSRTTLALSQQQASIAENQSQTAKDMAASNQQFSQQKLEMQLDALKQARTDQLAFDQKKQAFDQQIDQERIQLAQQQSQETIALNDLQFKTQLSALGMSSGFSKTINAANSLSVSRGGVSPGAVPTGAAGLGALGKTSLPGSNQTQGPSFANNSGSMAGRPSSSSARAIANAPANTRATQRLMIAALGTGAGGSGELTMRGIVGVGSKGQSFSLSTLKNSFLSGESSGGGAGSSGISISPTLDHAMKANPIVMGSTRTQRNYSSNHPSMVASVARGPSSGLSSFMHQTALIHDQQSPDTSIHGAVATSTPSNNTGSGSHGAPQSRGTEIGTNTYNPPSGTESFSLRRSLSPHASSRPIAN
jgi:hypothetical protein